MGHEHLLRSPLRAPPLRLLQSAIFQGRARMSRNQLLWLLLLPPPPPPPPRHYFRAPLIKAGCVRGRKSREVLYSTMLYCTKRCDTILRYAMLRNCTVLYTRDAACCGWHSPIHCRASWATRRGSESPALGLGLGLGLGLKLWSVLGLGLALRRATHGGSVSLVAWLAQYSGAESRGLGHSCAILSFTILYYTILY